MKGTLFGTGVGPGDPELLTLKALRTIQSSPIIAIPSAKKDRCTAYQIAQKAVPELDKKIVLPLSMPMTKDPLILKSSHTAAAASIQQFLDQGQDVCFLTLGDPTVYSTYMYIHQIISKNGYPTVILNGIPSFCAAAAAFQISLAEQSEPITIIPGSYKTDAFLTIPGTKVLMKSGKQLSNVKTALSKHNYTIYMAENCTMDSEKRYYSLEEIPDDSGYYSLIIAKSN